jgi:uncharacterized protein YukE
MAENTIQIQIDAGIEGFSKAIAQADKLTVKFTGNVVDGMKDASDGVKDLSKNIGGGLGGSISKLAAGVSIGTIVAKGVGIAAGAVKDFVAGSLAAYSEQEDALNKLSFALKASGDFSDDALKDFSDFASELQKTTKYGDETTLAMLALAKSFGASNEQAKSLVKAGADMAATFGGSLESRVEQLGKTFSGTSGKLGQLIPELKGLTEAQLKAGDAVDIIGKKFSGASENEIKTFSGSVEVMKNSISDFQEELGGLAANSSIFQSAIQAITTKFQGLTQAVVDSRIEAQRQKNGFKETDESVNQLARKYEDLGNKIEALEKKGLKLPKGLDSLDASKLALFRKELAALEKQTADAAIDANVTARQAAAATAAGTPVVPTKVVGKTDAQKQAIAEKAALIEQEKAIDLEYDIFKDGLAIAEQERTGVYNAYAYEELIDHENAKIMATQNAELERAKLIKDNGVRNQTEENIRSQARLAIVKNELNRRKEAEAERTKLERQESNTRLGIAQNFVQAGLAITKEGSLAQKALAITAATISTYQGATNALADTRPAYLAPAMAASIIAIGLANVSRIAGAKFETGGIVGGNSYRGDKVGVQVNSAEMILTREQQKTLFDDINNKRLGNGTGNAELLEAIRSMPIVVQANGREIARLVRNERENGFAI